MKKEKKKIYPHLIKKAEDISPEKEQEYLLFPFRQRFSGPTSIFFTSNSVVTVVNLCDILKSCYVLIT